jgi:O-antigen ligase
VVLVFFREELKALMDTFGFSFAIGEDEDRMRLIDRAKELFRKHPVTGHGLTYKGNFDIYNPKKGAMGWYHMMIPQVVASMGCVGILAYLYQGAMHLRVLFVSLRETREDAKERMLAVTLFMSYVGVLMMSQVNPGIFCPVPYGLMATVIFALIDGEYRGRATKKKKKVSKNKRV